MAITIPVTPEEIRLLETSLASVESRSRTATVKKIRKRDVKEALCLPVDRRKGDRAGGLVTSVVFQIEDDGSTAALLRTRRGSFERSFGLSIESTEELRAHLRHVANTSATKFQPGTSTKYDLDALFQ